MLTLMKRLQILIDEELDEALALEARRTSTSKAELIRRYVRSHLAETFDGLDDSLLSMAGRDDYDSEPVDEVVYG